MRQWRILGLLSNLQNLDYISRIGAGFIDSRSPESEGNYLRKYRIEGAHQITGPITEPTAPHKSKPLQGPWATYRAVGAHPIRCSASSHRDSLLRHRVEPILGSAPMSPWTLRAHIHTDSVKTNRFLSPTQVHTHPKYPYQNVPLKMTSLHQIFFLLSTRHLVTSDGMIGLWAESLREEKGGLQGGVHFSWSGLLLSICEGVFVFPAHPHSLSRR